LIGASVELTNLPVLNWPKRRRQLSFHILRNGCIVGGPVIPAAAEEYDRVQRDGRKNSAGGAHSCGHRIVPLPVL
jgi:murein endopeptidase